MRKTLLFVVVAILLLTSSPSAARVVYQKFTVYDYTEQGRNSVAVALDALEEDGWTFMSMTSNPYYGLVDIYVKRMVR